MPLSKLWVGNERERLRVVQKHHVQIGNHQAERKMAMSKNSLKICGNREEGREGQNHRGDFISIEFEKWMEDIPERRNNNAHILLEIRSIK